MAAPSAIPQVYQVLEYFSGCAMFSQTCKRAGYTTAAADKIIVDEHNINSRAGFANLVSDHILTFGFGHVANAFRATCFGNF